MKQHWQVLASVVWAEVLTVAVLPGPSVFAVVWCSVLAVLTDELLWGKW